MRILNPDYVKTIARAANECPYFSLLSMKITDLTIGRSTIEIDLSQKHLQPFGVAHGGVFSSLIDAATWWAAFTEVEQGVAMTTVDLKLNNLAPARTGKMIAHGRSIKMGRTLGLAEASVTNESGRLLAHGTSTLMLVPNLKLEGFGSLPVKFLEED